MSITLTLTLHDTLTDKQKRVLRSRRNFLILRGPAGTAKTYIGLARGLKLLQKGEVSRLVILRSAVETRRLGFLPGDQNDKIDVYADPYIHLINQLSPKKNYRALLAAKLIEFHSTSYLRGVTFDKAYMLVDEFQNMNEHELETIATRVGDGTHMTLCGDSAQSDLMYGEAREHSRVIRILESMPDFDVVNFGVEDIVRSGFVKRFYETKEALEDGALPVLPAFLMNGSNSVVQ